MKVALYIRVSTLEQAQEGYSLEAQQEKLIKYSNFQNYDIYNIYKDDGFSASSMDRPALQNLIIDIKRHKINTVIIYKLDRLSRKVKDVLELVELFENYNVTLYSLTENLDLSSPFGRAALKMSATFSELERENILERTQLGKDQRGKSGYLMPNRFNPFGYSFNKETQYFDIIEEQANIIKKIFELYINGYSFRKLYDYCKTNYPNESYFNNSMCCKPIIHRPMYAGYYSYKGDLIKGINFQPIIDMETYLKAQKSLQEHTTKRNSINTPYLLTGLIYCAKCGNRYVGKRRKHYIQKNNETFLKYEYTSYGCSARLKIDKKYSNIKCNNEIIDADYLNNYVINIIKNTKFNNLNNKKVSSTIIENLLSDNTELEDKKAKLLDIYLQDVISKETYIKKNLELDKLIKKNKTIINNETTKIETIPNYSIDIIKNKIKNFDKLNHIEKHQLLCVLIDKIIIDNNNIIVNLRVK